MAGERNYQHNIKCPTCNKRKVYLQKTRKGAQYVCEVDGTTWDAYNEGNVKPEFKKTTG